MATIILPAIALNMLVTPCSSRRRSGSVLATLLFAALIFRLFAAHAL